MSIIAHKRLQHLRRKCELWVCREVVFLTAEPRLLHLRQRPGARQAE